MTHERIHDRKVQKVGPSTLSVSLPREWVEETSLRRGDTVFLMTKSDGSLMLFPRESFKSEEEYVWDPDLYDEERMLERIIVGNYVLGRDLFSIVSSKRVSFEHVQEARKITRKLIGLGIVEETPGRITFHCSVDPRKYDFNTLLRRLSKISLTILQEATQALIGSKPLLARDAVHREGEADMLYLLGMRLLVSAQRSVQVAEEIGLKEPLHILYFGLMLRCLECAADYGEEIARRVAELVQGWGDRLPKDIVERISQLSDLAYGMIMKSVDSFFTGDIKTASSVVDRQKLIERKRDELMQNLPEIPHLGLILWSISRIADNGKGIALLAINNTVERETRVEKAAGRESFSETPSPEA